LGDPRGLRLALPVTGLIGQVEKPRLEDADFYSSLDLLPLAKNKDSLRMKERFL
jgi:hypothetical protein